MTTPTSATGHKPISFTDYIWRKCKSQPIVPIGIVATCAALGGATWHLRTGNRKRFNDFLRLRVIAQGLTVAAMVAYGSVAITREQQHQHYIKTQKLLGDLPPETPVPEASSRLFQPTPIDPDAPRPLSAKAIRAQHLKSQEPPVPTERTEADLAAYPLAKKDRVSASEFANRLREAERLQRQEDGARRPAKEDELSKALKLPPGSDSDSSSSSSSSEKAA